MFKTSDWLRLVLISIGVVLFFRLPPDPPERAKLAEAIPVQVEDEVPEPPENDGYVNESDIPPPEEDTYIAGASREFGEKYPFIIVDGQRLDFDRDSGHYRYTGTERRALFVRTSKDIMLGDKDEVWQILDNLPIK